MYSAQTGHEGVSEDTVSDYAVTTGVNREGPGRPGPLQAIGPRGQLSSRRASGVHGARKRKGGCASHVRPAGVSTASL